MTSLMEYFTDGMAAITGGDYPKACDLAIEAGKNAEKARPTLTLFFPGTTTTQEKRSRGRPPKTAEETGSSAAPATAARQRNSLTQAVYDLIAATPRMRATDEEIQEFSIAAAKAAGLDKKWGINTNVKRAKNVWSSKGLGRQEGSYFVVTPPATEQQLRQAS